MNYNEENFFNLECHNDILQYRTSKRRYDCIEFARSIKLKLSNYLTNNICMVYECKDSKSKNKFIPDITFYCNKIIIQVELKFKESHSSIIKEINGMRKFSGKEFWYVIGDNLDYWHILQRVDNNKVKVMNQKQYIEKIKELKGL